MNVKTVAKRTSRMAPTERMADLIRGANDGDPATAEGVAAGDFIDTVAAAHGPTPARAERISALLTRAEREGRALRAEHRAAALRGVVLDALDVRGVVLPRGRAPLPYEGGYCRARLGAPLCEVFVGALAAQGLDGSPEAVVEVLSTALAAHLSGGHVGCTEGARAVLAAAAGGCVGSDAHYAARRLAAVLVEDARRAAALDPDWVCVPSDTIEVALRDTIEVALVVLGVLLHEVPRVLGGAGAQ